jgi:ADP-heptose:LPS heptosyltransferase
MPVWFLFNGRIPDGYQLKPDEHVLETDSKDIQPYMFLKFKYALQNIYKSGSNPDYVLRCNATTFINVKGLSGLFSRLPKEKLMEIKEICKDNNLNHSLIRVASFIQFNKNNDKANTNIAVWIRNTTNDTSRNLPESIYSTLFDFCIQTKRHLHIFLDWQKVPVPESEYLHVYDNLRVNNSFLFDEFVKICNKSYLFIGCDSGTSWIAANYTKANCLIFSSQWGYGQITNPQPIFHNKEQFLDLINKIYHISIV